MFALTGCQYLAGQSTFYLNKIPGGELPPYKGLMGMCRWIGWHFHGWINYNGVAFRMGSQIFGFFG